MHSQSSCEGDVELTGVQVGHTAGTLTVSYFMLHASANQIIDRRIECVLTLKPIAAII